MRHIIPLLVLLVMPGSAEARRFEGKAVGNSASGKVAKHSFPIGAAYSLHFKDNARRGTVYRVCAFFNGVSQGCGQGRTGRRGRDSVKFSADIFNPQTTGRIIWRWYVGDSLVARWTVTITPGD